MEAEQFECVSSLQIFLPFFQRLLFVHFSILEGFIVYKHELLNAFQTLVEKIMFRIILVSKALKHYQKSKKKKNTLNLLNTFCSGNNAANSYYLFSHCFKVFLFSNLNPAYKQQHWIGARQSLLQSIQTYLQTNNSNP